MFFVNFFDNNISYSYTKNCSYLITLSPPFLLTSFFPTGPPSSLMCFLSFPLPYHISQS